MRTVHFFAAVMLLAVSTTHSDRRFTSKSCKCSFVAPRGWVVIANPEAKLAAYGPKTDPPRCAFALAPAGWPEQYAKDDDRDFGPYAIEIRVSRESFQQAAREANFEQVGTLRTAWEAPEFEGTKKA